MGFHINYITRAPSYSQWSFPNRVPATLNTTRWWVFMLSYAYELCPGRALGSLWINLLDRVIYEYITRAPAYSKWSFPNRVPATLNTTRWWVFMLSYAYELMPREGSVKPMNKPAWQVDLWKFMVWCVCVCVCVFTVFFCLIILPDRHLYDFLWLFIFNLVLNIYLFLVGCIIFAFLN